ncbi:ankyrin repeat-containing domain protein [Flagelloscypha sp. PMI_526]|nr:ankyrin repeat-containing domain protein [Flagelloscypha sp. PMI_526]
MASSSALDSALDTIIEQNQIQVDLSSPFGSKGEPIKWYGLFLVLASNSYPSSFVCVVNDKNTTHPRILRNYRIRTSPNPRRTIRQALRATLADGTHLPPVVLQHERLVSGVPRFANISRALMKELPVAVPRGTHLACFVNIGSGHPDTHSVAQELSSQYHDLGPCYFRLSMHREVRAMDETYSHTTEYLGADEVSVQIDCIVETLIQRYGVVPTERLGSLAGEDGKAKLVAQVEAEHEDVGYIRTNLDKNIFRCVKEWLQPVDHTAKLDENIQARGATTCEWFLEHPGVMKWKSGSGGSCWFHGAMGTGKTVIISYLIQSLIQGGSAVAYYYFDFTNSKTLSEEALFRSLVAQLSHANEACARVMYEKHMQGAVQPQLATLQDAFYKVASEAFEPVYVVIDAIDELPRLQRASLLKTLENTYSSPRARFYLIITSRDEVDISECLEGKVQFELAIADAMVRRDIAVVIEKELLSKKWKSWPKTERAMLKEHLNRRADGQFRIVACQIEVLRQVQTTLDLRKTLNLLPKKLGDTYSYILESIPEDLRTRAHALLSILSFAFEPVPLDELSALLAVEYSTNEVHLPKYREDSRYHQPQNIIGLGSALIRTEHSWGPAHPPFLRLARASCLSRTTLHNQISQFYERLGVDAYVRLWWYHHVPSNGSKQLLALQIALFQAFPWSSLRDFEIPLDAIGHIKQSEVFRYPLSAAAAAGLVDMLHSMLSTTQDINILNHALVVAAATGARLPVISLLVAQGADINTLNETIGTPLQNAASGGALDVVEFLVGQGASINLQGGYYGTPLNAAASEGKLEAVEFLLRRGADVNFMGHGHGTALQTAALLSRLDVVDFLIANGADVNVVAGDYGTALHAAAYIGSLHIVEFLVENGAKLDIVGGKYGTALLAAASEGEMKVVNFLVKKGADMNIVVEGYGTALQTAACAGCLPVVEFLVVNGADAKRVGGKYATALLGAAFEGEVEIVEFFVRRGIDINIMIGDYGMALQAAAYIGSGHPVEFLIGNGANLNIVNACRRGLKAFLRDAVIWHLLKHPGILPYLGFSDAHFPYRLFLISPVQNGNIMDYRVVYPEPSKERMELFCEIAQIQYIYEMEHILNDRTNDITFANRTPLHGTDFEAELHPMKTPSDSVPSTHGRKHRHISDPKILNQIQSLLYWAADNGYLELVRTLMDLQADPKIASTRLRWTPLHIASYKGHLDIVKVLLDSNVNPNAFDQNYRTPLHVAAYQGHLNVVTVLLLSSANANSAYGDGLTPRHWAVKKGHLNVVLTLLDFQADPSAGFLNFRTPLHIAAIHGTLPMVQVLLQYNASPNTPDINHQTPLHLAVNKGRLDVVQFLLESKADPYITDKNRLTAFHIAAYKEHLDVLQALLETERHRPLVISVPFGILRRLSNLYSSKNGSECIALGIIFLS